MVVFSFPQFNRYTQFLKGLPEYKLGRFQIDRFPNREIYAKINTNVADQDCLILGSISPPDENLISLLFLAHTLKKELTSKITAFLPYLAYARQDKIKKGESLATSTIGEIFRASHIDEVVIIDIHSSKVESLFPLPIHNLSPASVFAKEIAKLKLKNPSFIAPDEGAVERTQQVAKELGIRAGIAYMEKKRMPSGVKSILHGHTGDNAILIDDILDTGGTLVSCCEILKSKGVKNINIFVTHGLFTGNLWQHLFDLNVRTIFCTDSVPQAVNLQSENLKILSIKPILKEYIAHIKKIQKEAKRVLRKADKEQEDYFLGEEVG